MSSSKNFVIFHYPKGVKLKINGSKEMKGLNGENFTMIQVYEDHINVKAVSQILTFASLFQMGFGEGVDTFFSPRMWHHAGCPTTGHSTETIGINVTSPQETDNCTLILDKQKFKASISPKNELDYPS